MKRSQLALASVLASCAIAIALGGCGSDEDSATPAPESATATATTKPVKAALVTATFNDFSKAQTDEFEKEFKATGGGLTVFNSNFDPQKLQQQCQDAVASNRYNAMIVAVFEPPAGVPCAKVAAAAGLPVVALDTPIGTDPNKLEPQVDGVVGGVIITPEMNGQAGTDLVKRACADTKPCKVIVEVVTPTDLVTGLVVKDLKAAGIDVVQVLATQFDPAQVVKQLPDALAAHPDTNVFLAGTDLSAIAALPAVKAAKADNLIVLGQGGSRLGAKAVADGSLGGSTGSWPRQEASAAAKMIKQAVNGQKVDPTGVNALKLDTPLILDKDNVSEFTPEWGASR